MWMTSEQINFRPCSVARCRTIVTCVTGRRRHPRAGPVQVPIRRAFIASGAEVLSSTQIYDWTHSRRRQSRRKKLPFGVYWRTLKTLRAMCDPVERVPPHGAWLWRLRNTADILGGQEAAAKVVQVTNAYRVHEPTSGLWMLVSVMCGNATGSNYSSPSGA
jgi:hypothetical protein